MFLFLSLDQVNSIHLIAAESQSLFLLDLSDSLMKNKTPSAFVTGEN